MEAKQKQVISKKRVADHGEVLTARREVDAMLDLVKQETERIDSRFLEPACGNGNFLIAILERKIAVIERKLIQMEKHLKKSEKKFEWKPAIYEPDSLQALSSIYGIDILQDSIEEAKQRLLSYFVESYQRIVAKEIPQEFLHIAKFILNKNILLGDAINYQEKVTIPGVPGLDQIIFTEWTRVGDDFKRREYRFDSMHLDWKNSSNQTATDDLFESTTPPTHKAIHKADSGENVLQPVPVREYPFTHFSKLNQG